MLVLYQLEAYLEHEKGVVPSGHDYSTSNNVVTTLKPALYWTFDPEYSRANKIATVSLRHNIVRAASQTIFGTSFYPGTDYFDTEQPVKTFEGIDLFGLDAEGLIIIQASQEMV